jgi:hypothetical protein
MTEKNHLCLIPKESAFVPAAEAERACLDMLKSEGVIAESGDGRLVSGQNVPRLLVDPAPVAGAAPFEVASIRHDRLVGHAGKNLEPTECPNCGSEMPYDANFDGFAAVNAGEEKGSGMRMIQCLHCEHSTDVTDLDFRRSGGFCRYEIRFSGRTSSRVSADEAFLRKISRILGAPMKFIQVSE